MPGAWLWLLHRQDLIGRDVPQGLHRSTRPPDFYLVNGFDPSETEVEAAGARRCIPHARRDVAPLSAGPHARADPVAVAARALQAQPQPAIRLGADVLPELRRTAQ